MAVDASGFTCHFAELCEKDCYHIREVPFVPDVVLDIGANVGVFTSYTRHLFPKARIIALEPDPRNWMYLQRFTGHLPNVIHVNKALGTGPIWHVVMTDVRRPYYGGLQSYVTLNQLGYSRTRIETDPRFEPAYLGIEVISLGAMVGQYVPRGTKVLTKIDIEGGENCIFTHKPSRAALRRMDYLTMEIHFRSMGTGPEYVANKQFVSEVLMSLSDTHDCILDADHYYFQATRKGSNV